jgi:flagellar basal-body rod protein FlgG
LPQQTSQSQIGQIQLARFVNPEGLAPRGNGIFGSTDASNSPTTGNPGQDGIGVLRQGGVERSNVDVEQELKRLSDCRRRIAQLRGLLAEDGL